MSGWDEYYRHTEKAAGEVWPWEVLYCISVCLLVPGFALFWVLFLLSWGCVRGVICRFRTVSPSLSAVLGCVSVFCEADVPYLYAFVMDG